MLPAQEVISLSINDIPNVGEIGLAVRDCDYVPRSFCEGGNVLHFSSGLGHPYNTQTRIFNVPQVDMWMNSRGMDS